MILCKIIGIYPMEKREYTAKSGEVLQFKSKKVTMMCELGTFIGELIEETAQHFEDHPLTVNSMVFADVRFQFRKSLSKDNREFFSNDVIISKVIEL